MCFTRSVRKILGTKTGGGKTFKGRIWPVCCSVRHSRWLVACLGWQWPLGEIILGSHLCPDLSHKCCKELREGCFVSNCQEFFSYYVKPYATIDQASDSVFSQPNVTRVSLKHYQCNSGQRWQHTKATNKQTNNARSFYICITATLSFGCLIYEGSMPFILQCMNVAILQEQKNTKSIKECNNSAQQLSWCHRFLSTYVHWNQLVSFCVHVCSKVSISVHLYP